MYISRTNFRRWSMILGMCLPGGGAKGAFQGGVIKRLNENGISPIILTGTSIGAINSYFIMRDSYKKLEEFWTSIDKEKFTGKIDKTIDNSVLIDILSQLQEDNKNIRNAYVNYVSVINQNLKEVIVDIKNTDSTEALNSVRYSSLLPARAQKDKSPEETAASFNSQNLFQNFQEDVEKGVYDGYNLDGGILNNNLLSPFITNKVDKILIVGLKSDYVVPEYIYKYYDNKDVIVINPNILSSPGDTLRFEKTYCLDMYERGYKIAKTIGDIW
jgi:NTE family protein